jgi:hypothetical protein
MGKLEGKTAQITGGNSGIGLNRQAVCKRRRLRVHHRAPEAGLGGRG